MFKTKGYRDTADLIRDPGDDPELAAEIETHLSERRLVRQLFALRCAKRLSQKDIAEKMGCSQGRISKLEASRDDDLSLGDIRGYAMALGLSTILGFEGTGVREVDLIKFHAGCIKHQAHQLAEYGCKDEEIGVGVGQFFNEAVFNLIRIVCQANEKLPPEIRQHAGCLQIVGPDDEHGHSESEQPVEAPQRRPSRRKGDFQKI